MKIGDTVFFVKATPNSCEHCSQILSSLSHSVDSGRIIAIDVFIQGEWPLVKTCDCEEDCFCARFPDYTAKPTQHVARSYRVMTGDTLLSPIPKGAFFPLEEEASKVLESGVFTAVYLGSKMPSSFTPLDIAE